MSALADYHIREVNHAITWAERGHSKLAEFHFSIEGMSSYKGRHFLNNLLSGCMPARRGRYLEVGSWRGSTLCAATFGNDIEAVAIDNFSEFTNLTFGRDQRHPREAIRHNVGLNQAFSHPRFDVTILDEDAFGMVPTKLGLFDVYLYDGQHTYDAHYKALTHFALAMRDTFVLVVDDYRNLPEDGTHQATEKAIADLGWKVHQDWFLYDECDGTPEAKQAKGWWNGLRVSVVSKP